MSAIENVTSSSILARYPEITVNAGGKFLKIKTDSILSSPFFLEKANQWMAQNPKEVEKLQSKLQPIRIPLSTLAEGLGVPLHVISFHSNKGTLQKFFDDTIEIESLSKKAYGEFAKVFKDANRCQLVTDLYRSVLINKKLYPNPSNKGIQKTIELRPDFLLQMRDTGDSVQLKVLDAVMIGRGEYGIVFRCYDVMLQKLSCDKAAVAKFPCYRSSSREEQSAREDLLNEIRMLKKVNRNGPVLGLQGNAQSVGSFYIGYTTELYTTSLQTLISAVIGFSNRDRLSMITQIFHGLAYLHENSLTHGDIDPHNIFIKIDLSQESRLNYSAHIGDFGGMTDHRNLPDYIRIVMKPLYCPRNDQELFYDLSFRVDGFQSPPQFFKLATKIDIFETCATVIYFILGELPYEDRWRPYDRKDEYGIEIDEDNLPMEDIDLAVSAKLGFSLDVSRMLVQGLEENPNSRPSAKAIYLAIFHEVRKIDPVLYRTLQSMVSIRAEDD